MRKEYNKLVRDKIPEIIINSGKSCKIKRVMNNELRICTYEKVDEELNEFKEAYNKNNCPQMFEELVDLITISLAYFTRNNYLKRYDNPNNCPDTLNDLVDAVLKKVADKGAFDKGYILLEVEDDE